jgi:hypothetical protein
MSQLRAVVAETEFSLPQRSDDEVIQILARLLATGILLAKDQNQRRPHLGIEKPMTGYFTMLEYLLRARTVEQLEAILGYRRGRISARGAFIYRFLRVPELNEFEVAGSTITPQKTPDGKGWDQVDLPARKAALAQVAAYHQNTKVPTFDEIQKKNARDTMDVEGDNTLVKIYPIEDLGYKETYPFGQGVAQWRLTRKRNGEAITGTLLVRIPAGGPLPWVQPRSTLVLGHGPSPEVRRIRSRD